MASAPQTPFVASTLAPNVYQSAVSAQLGDQPSADFRVTLTRKGLITGLISLIIGLALVIGGVAIYTGSSSSDTSGSGALAVMGIIGVCFWAGGVYCLLYRVLYQSWHVYVYERGFVYTRGNRAPQPFRWDQIEALWYQVTRQYYNGVYVGTTHRYRVRRQDGLEIMLNDRFTNVGKLGEILNDKICAAKLPRVLDAYNAGQVITFGPLSLSKQGLQNTNGTLLPWSEIKDISVQRGFVAVSKAGKWLKWSNQPIANIPNAMLFINLATFILKQGANR